MKVDFKITIWERVRVPDNLSEEVLSKLKSGEISSSEDLYNFLEDGFESEFLLETGEQLLITENDGQATIEVVDEKRNIIFNNGIEN